MSDGSVPGNAAALHEELRARVLTLQLMTENLPVILWTTDLDMRCTSVTGAALSGVRLRPADVLGRSVAEIIGYWDPKAPVFTAHRRALEGNPCPFDIEFKGRHFQAHVSPQFDAQKRVTGSAGIALDITERIHAEMEVRHREREMDDLFENAPVGLHQLNSEAQIVRANRAELAMLGYAREEYIGHPVTDFFVDAHLAARVQETLRRHENIDALEASLRSRDGKVKYIQMSCNWFVQDGLPLYSRGFMRDITEIKSSWAQLKYKATHDPLTGVLNRDSFMEMLSSAAAQHPAKKFAVLFVDVDNLKQINDAYGHLFGDEVLVEVTRAMQSCIRPGDVLARYAGDEFTILAFDIEDEPGVRNIAVRIQREFAANSKLTHEGLTPSLTIGVALGENAPAEVLLREADNAMYTGKASGKSSVRIATRPSL
jgi:diguanylate cyclase (GGDEF)-like protein/PAS domain S-box-containing protein